MNPSLDFAFEGFRIIRAKPYAVLVWGLLLLSGNVVGLYALAALAGPSLDAMQHMQQNPPQSEAQLQAMAELIPPILAGYGVALPLQLVVGAFVACAVFRAVLGRDNKGPAWLGFGIDEMRQIGAGLLFSAVIIGALFAAILVASIFAGIVSAALGLPPAALATAASFGAMAAVAAFMLRLSFFGVQTFDEGRINIFGSLVLTRARFWWLAGGYLITGIMVLLVFLLCLAIFAAFAAGLSGGDTKVLEPIFSGGTLRLAMFRNPVMLAYILVTNGLVAPLTVALSAGAPAAAYRALRGDTSPARAETLF